MQDPRSLVQETDANVHRITETQNLIRYIVSYMRGTIPRGKFISHLMLEDLSLLTGKRI